MTNQKNDFRHATFARLLNGKAVMIDACSPRACQVTMVYTREQFWVSTKLLKNF